METRPYYEKRLPWSALACGDSDESKIEREKLLKYYYNLLVADLKIDTWFGNKLTIDHIEDVFEQCHYQLVERQTFSFNGIPFLPVINSKLWTPDTTLKLLSMLEHDSEGCIIENFKCIQDRSYETRPLHLDPPMTNSIYFLADIEVAKGESLAPIEFQKKCQKESTSGTAHLFSLEDLAMLTYMHPTVMSEASFIAGGTYRQTQEQTTYYPLLEFNTMKNGSKEFVSKEIISDARLKTTRIPIAYEIYE